MRIIDEKGRLFGKINIIDFLVIIFLLSLTPIFYFGYKISNKKPELVKVQESEQKAQEAQAALLPITIRAKFVKLKPEVVKTISVGDKELNKNGDLIGEIIDIKEFLPYIYRFNFGEAKQLITKDPILKQAVVTLKINAELKGKDIYYKEKQIVQGGELDFSSGKYSVETEDIAIIEDSQNAYLDNTTKDTSAKEEQIAAIKNELGLRLTALEKRMNSSLEQLTDRINKLENINSPLPIIKEKN